MSAPDRPLAGFVAEAVETAETLGRELVRLDTGGQGDGEPPPAVLNAVFRHAHSLKGLAALYGQGTLAELAHAAEDLLDRLRLGRLRLREPVMDALSEAVELFQRLATAAESGPGGRGSSWNRVTGLGHLTDACAPMSATHQTPSPAQAAALRAVALALTNGVTAEGAGGSDADGVLRTVAATVTLVEGRGKGQSPAGEAIILAVE